MAERCTGVVDMNRIDDALVRVVKSSGLTRLKHVQSDDFTASNYLG
jgi:hypothetical protein